MNVVSVLIVLGYLGIAAYHGQVTTALDTNAKLMYQASWFFIAVLILWGLHEIKAIRVPVDIFIAIVVTAVAMNDYQKVSTELSAAGQYLGTVFNKGSTGITNVSATGSNIIQFPSGGIVSL